MQSPKPVETAESIWAEYVQSLRKLIYPGESLQKFFSAVFETQSDAVVEMYEFVAIMQMIRAIKAENKEVTRKTMNEQRSRPFPEPMWTFDENGDVDKSDKVRYAVWKKAFHMHDTNKDGVLSINEVLFGAIKKTQINK